METWRGRRIEGVLHSLMAIKPVHGNLKLDPDNRASCPFSVSLSLNVRSTDIEDWNLSDAQALVRNIWYLNRVPCFSHA